MKVTKQLSKLFVLSALALAVQGAMATGVESGHERSNDDSNKASKLIGAITLFNSAREAVAPIDSSYIQNAWYFGTSLEAQVSSLLSLGAVSYEDSRIAELSSSSDFVARYVATLYRSCGSDENCVIQLAWREVLAQFVQSASFPQQLITLMMIPAATLPSGYGFMSDRDWPSYRDAAVTATYAANVIDTYIAANMPKGSASIEQRRLAAGKLMFTLPSKVMNAALGCGQRMINLPPAKIGGPLDFSVDGFAQLHVDAEGVTATISGTTLYGKGNIINSHKIEYSNDAAGSVKSTTATKKISVK